EGEGALFGDVHAGCGGFSEPGAVPGKLLHFSPGAQPGSAHGVGNGFGAGDVPAPSQGGLGAGQAGLAGGRAGGLRGEDLAQPVGGGEGVEGLVVVHVGRVHAQLQLHEAVLRDRKSTRLNSSHVSISYAVFRLIRPPSVSPPSPYTTLFRSRPSAVARRPWRRPGGPGWGSRRWAARRGSRAARGWWRRRGGPRCGPRRPGPCSAAAARGSVA